MSQSLHPTLLVVGRCAVLVLQQTVGGGHCKLVELKRLLVIQSLGLFSALSCQGWSRTCAAAAALHEFELRCCALATVLVMQHGSCGDPMAHPNSMPLLAAVNSVALCMMHCVSKLSAWAENSAVMAH